MVRSQRVEERRGFVEARVYITSTCDLSPHSIVYVGDGVGRGYGVHLVGDFALFVVRRSTLDEAPSLSLGLVLG